MRRWLILLPLALIATAWLVLRPGESSAVAPAGTQALEGAAERATLIAVEGAQRSSADESAVEPPSAADDEPPGPTEPSELEPIASLTVRAFLPDGTPWKNGRLRVDAESSLSKVEIDSGNLSGKSSRFSVRAPSARGDIAWCDLDERGAVRLRAAESLTLAVHAIDAVGCIGASATDIALLPGEQRSIDLRSDRFPRPLLGRCVDEQGRPLAGATVDVHSAFADHLAVRSFVRRTTDAAGEFDTPPLFVGRVNVRATLEDRISAERFDVPIGGAAIELVLRRGRQLVVELRDDYGQAFHDAGLFVHEQGGDGPLDLHSEPCDEGRLYTALPDRPLELRWGAPCAPESLAVEVGVERVFVPVRRSGSLAIEVGPLPGDTDSKYEAGLYCLDGTTPAWPPKTVLNTGHQQVQWTLPPGRYVLQLLHLPDHAPEAWAPWGAPIEVEVRSGATTFERVGGGGDSGRARD